MILANRRPDDDIPEEILTFAETGYTRGELLDLLKTRATVPSSELAIAIVYAPEIEQGIVEVLERGQTERLDQPSAWLLWRGLHILGGRRLTSAYRPLIAFLRGPEDRVDVLGDTITETLSQIIAGVFDGDLAPLLTLIGDNNADEWARNAALGALAFLTFDGRIPRDTTKAFLLRFRAGQCGACGACGMAWVDDGRGAAWPR